MSKQHLAPSQTLQKHPNDGWVMADPLPMSAPTRRAFRAIIAALCPPRPTPGEVDMIDVVEQHSRRLIRYMHPVSMYGFILAIHLVNWSPIWMFQTVWPMTRLSRVKASRVLETMSMSALPPLRMLIVAVRGIVLSTYFDQECVHTALGYEPRPFMQSRVELRKRLLAGNAATVEDALPSVLPPHAEVAIPSGGAL